MYVEDVEKTVVFYESAFGLRRKLLHENDYGELDTGATKLAFVSHAMAQSGGIEYSKPDPNAPAPAVEIAFVTDDVAAAYEKAVQEVATALIPPKEKPWGQTVAYVRDLNGFLVELCTAVAE